LREVVGTACGCTAVQRDRARLEKWDDRNLMKFSTGKCKVLYLGRNNPMYQHELESSFVDK